MIQISTHVLAKSQDTGLAILLLDNEISCAPLREKERETLRQLPREVIVADPNALPLQVHLVEGSPKRLSIFPAPGGRIKTPGIILNIENNGFELTINPEPLRQQAG